MVFRKADMADLESIFQIYRWTIENMKIQNIDMWDDVYPDLATIREDIQKGQMYIGVLEGEILSAYVLNRESDEEYKDGNWQYPDASYFVIHRLCVNPFSQGRGIGTKTMLQIEKQAQSMGAETIRLDVFAENPRAQHLYQKLGYRVVGNVAWRKGTFYLMEKKLDGEEE